MKTLLLFLITCLSAVLSNHSVGDDVVLNVSCTAEKIQVSWTGMNKCPKNDKRKCYLKLNYTDGNKEPVVWPADYSQSIDSPEILEIENYSNATISGYYIIEEDYSEHDYNFAGTYGWSIREVSVTSHSDSGYCLVNTGRVGDDIAFNCTDGVITLWWNEHCQEMDCILFPEVSCNNSLTFHDVITQKPVPQALNDSRLWTIEWPENVTECTFTGSYRNGTSTNTVQQYSIRPFSIRRFEDCTDAPIFLASPENLTVVVPEDATFFCESTARPEPAITWWRVEEGVHVQLLNGTNYTIVDEATGEGIRNSTLTVIGTEPSDALDYFCRASNMAGMVEATAELTVHVVPEIVFTGEGFSYKADEFQPIAFTCQATGIPAPTINWYRNGVLLNEARVSIAPPSETPPEGPNDVFSVLCTLTINSTRDDDSDNYICVADNGNRRMPNVTQNFELFVRVAPVIQIPPENLTVISPNNATFFCQATARPGPDITWWRVEDDGNISRVMETAEEYAIVNVEMGERVRNSTLVVIDSQPSDTGVYRCLANNVSYDSATANLIVYAPNPSPSPSSSPSSSPAIIVAPVCTVGLAILVLVFAVAFIRHKKKRSNPFKYFGKPYADPIDKNYDPVRISRDPTVESLKTLLEPYNSNESQLEHNDSGTNSLYERKHAKSDEHQISNNTLVPTIVISAPECAQPTLHIERDGYIHRGIPTPLAYDEQATMMEDDTDIADVSHALATVTEFNCVPGAYGQPVSQSDGKGYVTLKDQVNSPIVEDQGFTLETGYEKLSLVESSNAASGLISSLATSVAPGLPPVLLAKEPTSLPAAAIDTSSVVAATAPPHTSTSPFQSGDSRPSAVVLQVSEAPFLHPTTTAATTTTTSSSSSKEPTAPGPTPSPTSGTTSEGGVAHSHGPAPPLLQAGSEDSTLQLAEPPGVEDLDMGGMENDVEPIGASSEQHPGSMTGYLSFDGGRAGNSSANPFETPLQPTNEAMRYSSRLFPVTNFRLPTEVLPTASFTQPDITCPLVLAS